MEALEKLLDKRLLLVTGKGGVGKTTVAASLAVMAVRHGKRVVVCEIDGPSAIAPLLGGTPGHLPSLVGEGVHLAVLSPEEGLRAYLRERLPIPGVLDLALRNPVVTRFFRAAPAVPEVSLLFAIERLLTQEPRWDLVIVDLPASGHALALLEAPFQGQRIFPIGPVRALCDGLAKTLTDRSTTACVVVTLPEELPVNEALELVHRLETLGLAVEAVLANAVAPQPFDQQEQALVEELLTQQRPHLLSGTQAAIKRSTRARRALERLREGLSKRPIDLPFRLERGRALIRALAKVLP